MQNGIVKWFNSEKGYGFISSEGKEYFVHFKTIQMNGYKNLSEGQQVCFEASNSPKGMTAVNVTLVPNT
jgi:CspA family cold shock protein